MSFQQRQKTFRFFTRISDLCLRIQFPLARKRQESSAARSTNSMQRSMARCCSRCVAESFLRCLRLRLLGGNVRRIAACAEAMFTRKHSGTADQQSHGPRLCRWSFHPAVTNSLCGPHTRWRAWTRRGCLLPECRRVRLLVRRT